CTCHNFFLLRSESNNYYTRLYPLFDLPVGTFVLLGFFSFSLACLALACKYFLPFALFENGSRQTQRCQRWKAHLCSDLPLEKIVAYLRLAYFVPGDEEA